MKTTLVLLAATVFSASASATSINLLTNGSFESFSGGAMTNGTTFNTSANPLVITGWTTTKSAGATNPGNGVSVQQTPGTTLYGGTTTADNAGSISPDAAGSHAAYFVDDTATETLSQTIALVAGTAYSVGFDYYQVQTGNPNPFTLSTTLGTQAVTTVTSATATPGTWFNASQTFVAPTSGNQRQQPIRWSTGFMSPRCRNRSRWLCSAQGGGGEHRARGRWSGGPHRPRPPSRFSTCSYCGRTLDHRAGLRSSIACGSGGARA